MLKTEKIEKNLKKNLFLKSRNLKSLCIMLKAEKIEKNLKQIFFLKSQNRKPLRIMLKTEKIEKNLKNVFFEITKPEIINLKPQTLP